MKPIMKPVPDLTGEVEIIPPPPSNKPKWTFKLLIATNILLLTMACVFVKLILDRQRRFNESINQNMIDYKGELEQLRTDVITTSSENVVYLKIMLLKPGIDKLLARDIAHSLVIRAREHHRDPDLVLAIIDVESNFNPNAVSGMGAVGLTQIMEFWKGSLGIDRDLRDIDTNIKVGLDILAMYEKTFGGLELALTAYNRGPSPVVSDIKAGKVPFNGYSENIMRTYARIKSWTRP